MQVLETKETSQWGQWEENNEDLTLSITHQVSFLLVGGSSDLPSAVPDSFIVMD